MNDRPYNVLFLCTANSARSIMAEAILNDVGAGRFKAYSAGSHPVDQVHPVARDLLERLGLATAELHSKSWKEFTRPGAPVFDFVFTVCDNVAGETCPIWPGRPMTAHWGFADPALFEGSVPETAAVFARTYREIRRRIEAFVALPISSLGRLALERELDRMGE
jgi:arsenate reductase